MLVLALLAASGGTSQTPVSNAFLRPSVSAFTTFSSSGYSVVGTDLQFNNLPYGLYFGATLAGVALPGRSSQSLSSWRLGWERKTPFGLLNVEFIRNAPLDGSVFGSPFTGGR